MNLSKMFIFKNIKSQMKMRELLKDEKSINEGMLIAAGIGNEDFVNKFIAKGADNWDECMYEAAKCSNNFDIIKLFISKGSVAWSWGMQGAIEAGHENIFNFFIDKIDEHCEDSGDQNFSFSFGLQIAAKHKRWKIVKYLIKKGAELDLGMAGAVEKGHKDMVVFLISKGAKNWNMALTIAVDYDHANLVEFFINKGADEWRLAMKYAIKSGNKELTELVISKYRNSENNTCYYSSLSLPLSMNSSTQICTCNESMYIAAEYGHMNLVKLFISKGANNWKEGLNCALKGKHKSTINFFSKKCEYSRMLPR